MDLPSNENNEDLGPALTLLTAATTGLLFPSETDSPVVPYTYSPDGRRLPSSAALRRKLGRARDVPVEQTTIDDFFAPVTVVPPELAGDAATESTAARFRALVALLQTRLRRPRVYRVGTINIDVYVLGVHPTGGVLGLQTSLIET